MLGQSSPYHEELPGYFFLGADGIKLIEVVHVFKFLRVSFGFRKFVRRSYKCSEPKYEYLLNYIKLSIIRQSLGTQEKVFKS